VDVAVRLNVCQWERGYVGTSPKAIQERSGAGQGSMYHHFGGKPDLALAAIRRSAEDLRASAEPGFSGPGTVTERISAYLRRERDVLKGCPVGRPTQNPDVMADPELRRPVEETFSWLTDRLAGLLAEGRATGELDAGLDPVATATALVAVLQGGYVLARAAGSAQVYARAIDGALGPDAEYQQHGITREHLLTGDLSARPGRVDRVEIYQVTLPPGQATGRHTHPGGVAGYVTSGEIAFEPEGQPGRELRAGSAFFEPAAATISRFDNLSAAEPATFIGCYLLTGDEPLIQPL
jgi:TetR/AcrR family transcriptional regulator, transcriptional repressor for nem operon